MWKPLMHFKRSLAITFEQLGLGPTYLKLQPYQVVLIRQF